MAKKPKIAIVDGDDWMGYHENGKLIEDLLVDILRRLGFDVVEVFVDTHWLSDRGNLPDALSEVKRGD